jgi:hypothetical protein
VIFPRPADEHAWSTRAVLGEELWITERPRDTAMAVNAAATLAGITALIAARRHRAAPAAGATAVLMALLLVYWRLMARYYNQQRRANTGRTPNTSCRPAPAYPLEPANEPPPDPGLDSPGAVT